MSTKNARRATLSIARPPSTPPAPASPARAREAALRDAESRAVCLAFDIRQLKIASALDGLREALTPDALAPHRDAPYYGTLLVGGTMDTSDVPKAFHADKELRRVGLSTLQQKGRVDALLARVIGLLRDFLEAHYGRFLMEPVAPEEPAPAA
jgi:hypothetical protein